MRLKLHTQIFFGIILGIICGILFREHAVFFQPLGDIFVRMLRMVTVPIVFTSLVIGVVSLGNIQHLGRLGAKTFGYFLLTGLAAVLLGLLIVNILKPGVNSNFPIPEDFIASDYAPSGTYILDVLQQTIPDNIIRAVVNEEILGIIFFSVLFGCGLLAIGKKGAACVGFIEGMNDAILKMTEWIMYLAPVGVFSLMATLVGKMGIAAFKPLGLFMFCVILGLLVHAVFVYGSVLIFVAKYSPFEFVKRSFPALATAFSTDSSVVTLPVTMETLEKEIGVSKKISGFVAPLAATLNMDGTALYEAVAAMFIAQVYGVHMNMTQQVIIALTSVLASIGAAGIPSAGLVTMVIVLRSVNLPLEGIGLLLAIDRVLDMCRTTINVMGDMCGAIVVSRMEGERLSVEN